MKNGNRTLRRDLWNWAALATLLAAGAGLAAASGAARAQSQPTRADACARPRVEDIRGGGNGGLPSPFGIANRVFELAAGEEYVLFGRLRVSGTQAALEIDFEKQPWLASDARCANPFYPLRAVPEAWLRFPNRAVRMRVVAATEIVHTRSGSLALEILLSPVSSTEGRAADILVFEEAGTAAP